MPPCCPPGGYCPTHQAYLDQAEGNVVRLVLPGHSPSPLPAKGRLTVPQYDSKLEARYAEEELPRQHQAGLVYHWWYKPGSLRLGPHHHYRPDFLVQLADGSLVMDDTKGYLRDDSWKAIKMAATRYACYRFRLVRYAHQRWTWTDVPYA